MAGLPSHLNDGALPLVDLHTHLLPGVDDGVRSVDEALEQLRDAARQGVVALACTPHTRVREGRDLLGLLDERRRVHDQLLEAVMREPGLPQVGLGAEVLLIDDPELSLAPPGMRINDTPYALVEVLFGLPEFATLLDLFRRHLDAGHRLILAHAERYVNLRRDDLIDRWHEEGVLIQVNASSIVGEHGEEIRRRALALIEAGRADLVASDVHGEHMRISHLARSLRIVRERAGEAEARRLFAEVPAAIFEGAPIPARAPARNVS